MLRRQRFAEPLPMTAGKTIYDHVRETMQTIILRLDTAFAKLNVAVPALELARHGASYFADSITPDPITLLVTLAGCLALLWRGDRARHLLVLGIVLHGLYLLRIGGDFMSGRFFGAPLVLTLATLLTSDELRAALATRVERALLACIVLYGALWPNSRLRVDFGHGVGRTLADVVAPSGIANERAYYYPSTGLMRVLAYEDDIAREELPVPPYREAIRGRAYARSDDRIQVASEVGFFGYFAEDKLVIDGWALSDAFLARIPFESRGSFRVGHYARPIPRGYVESRASGHN